jgi:hypothetical protein
MNKKRAAASGSDWLLQTTCKDAHYGKFNTKSVLYCMFLDVSAFDFPEMDRRQATANEQSFGSVMKSFSPPGELEKSLGCGRRSGTEFILDDVSLARR